jgi:broad specificity phosphatase PhoE
MGCLGSKPKGPLEEKVAKHSKVSRKGRHYFLNQSFAIVRHGDRLDHSPEWETYPEAVHYPNDTPLTIAGFKHATEVGNALKKTGVDWGLIVASPYLRCAQTASCIAQVLKLPIHFDLDIGEVFDDVSMKGDCHGKQQHRTPEVLEAKLKHDFSNVNWIRDDTGDIKIEGKLQDFPEPFDFARMRYAYKVKKLVQQAASQLMSIVIVTHGDAVGSVMGLMREDWQIVKVAYTAFAVASRKVKVMERGTENLLKEEPVYVDVEQWDIKLSPGLQVKQIGAKQKRKAHEQHEIELKEMNKQANVIQTSYELDDVKLTHFKRALSHLGAHEDDEHVMLSKAEQSQHYDECGKTARVLCSPHSGKNERPEDAD